MWQASEGEGKGKDERVKYKKIGCRRIVVAGVRMGVKGKDEHVKREKIGRGRIMVGDSCKEAIVFFIPPSN